MKDVLVLMSGGIDSTILCHYALQTERFKAALFIDFEQPAKAK